MNFFTIKWWHGDCENDTASVDYCKHYELIKAHLPHRLISLYDNVSLHDSHLETIEYEDFSLKIRLHLVNGSRIELAYHGVEKYSIKEDRKNAFGGTGFDDLGYFEYDLRGELAQMNILFSTAIEMEIIFKSFDYKEVF